MKKIILLTLLLMVIISARTRQQNSSGAETDWSTVASSLFYTVDLAPLPDISQLEYFIDADPGFGFAIPVSITNGINQTANFNVITAGLYPGTHMLVVRVKDADGDWSMAANQLFYVFEPEMADMIRMEYYVDDDPGYGFGTEIPVTPGQNLTLTLPVDSTEWTAGEHTFFLRIKNSAGDWSLVNSFSFPVPFQRSWKGVVSDEWNRVQNWNPPGIPASTEDLVIKGDAIHMPVIRIEGLSCNALEVEPGAIMTIQQPNTFTVTGN